MADSVVIMHSLYYPNIVGGAEISTQILAESLASHIKVSVITVGPHKQGILKEVINRVDVYRLPRNNFYWYGERPLAYNPAVKLAWRIKDAFNIRQYKAIKKILADIRPSVIHTQNLPGLSLAAWKAANDLKIPVIHTLRDYSLISPIKENFYNKPYSLLSRRFSSSVYGVVGISKYILDEHVRNGYFRRAKKLVISNVVQNTEDFEKKTINDGPLTIGYFGQLSANKGIEFLMEGVSKLSDEVVKKLIICGDGELRPDLERKASSDKRVIFMGKLKTEEVRNMMRQSDIVIVPSVWDEPFGRVIIESYQVGTPVYASCVGGIPEVILDQDEFLFQPRNADAIAASIMKYYRLPSSIKEELSMKCSSYSKQFDLENHITKYLQAYEDITALHFTQGELKSV